MRAGGAASPGENADRILCDAYDHKIQLTVSQR